MGEARVVRAAGGLVVDGPRVLVVHRPKYDDWTFPKGKAHDDETDVECALREVEEETGLRCAVERPFGQTRYADSRGRPKVVTYFLMRPLGGAFVPDDEVDGVRWVTTEEAADVLSYARDVELLRSL